MTTTPGGVRVWSDEPDVLRVRLDRPERRNAQNPEMWADLREIGASIDDRIRFVVIDGSHPDFSAGLDRSLFEPDASGISLTTLATEPDHALDAFIREAQDAFRVWRSARAHVIASVSGNAIGAGFQLALAADLLVVHTDANLVLREVALGIIPDLGATATLIPALGYSRTVALLGGVPLSGRQAYDWGLATAVSDRPEEATADLIAALRAANPDALRATKSIAREVVSGADSWDTERNAQMRLLRNLVGRGSR